MSSRNTPSMDLPNGDLALNEFSSELASQHSDSGRDDATLARVDGGRRAWSFLFAATVLESVLWVPAFPLTFGVFQDYYSKQPQFHGNSHIAVIGTLATSFYYLGAPLTTPLVKRFHRYQRHFIVVGFCTTVVALIAASFTNSIAGLIGTQGLLYGIALPVLYYPLLSMLNEWFVQRRGFAFGVLCAGAGAGGVVLPFIMEALLSKYGYRTTLRAVAVANVVLIGPLLPLLKGRLPPAMRASLQKIDSSFFARPLFYCFAVSNLFQAFAFFIPFLYLPSFATTLGYSAANGAMLLALNNGAQIFGQVAFGYLSDRTSHILVLVFLSSFGAAIASLTLWGLAKSIAPLAVFSLLYGSFAGGFVTLWPRFGMALTDDPETVFSFLAFGKGIGNVAAGPISAALLMNPDTSHYGVGRYEAMILFVGACMICSSFGIFGWPLKGRTISD